MSNSIPITGQVVRGNATQLAAPLDVVNALREVAGIVQDVIKLQEGERTRRTEIEARRSAAVRSIKASERVIRDYLEGAFAERRDTVHGLFRGMDAAIANGDNEALRTVVGGVVDLVRQSPIGPEIRDLAAAFGDPMQVWEI